MSTQANQSPLPPKKWRQRAASGHYPKHPQTKKWQRIRNDSEYVPDCTIRTTHTKHGEDMHINSGPPNMNSKASKQEIRALRTRNSPPPPEQEIRGPLTGNATKFRVPEQEIWSLQTRSSQPPELEIQGSKTIPNHKFRAQFTRNSEPPNGKFGSPNR